MKGQSMSEQEDRSRSVVSAAQRSRQVRFCRNSPSSFLLGASWSHHHEWPQRTTHIYLGPWLLTFVVRSAPDAEVFARGGDCALVPVQRETSARCLYDPCEHGVPYEATSCPDCEDMLNAIECRCHKCSNAAAGEQPRCDRHGTVLSGGDCCGECFEAGEQRG